MGVILRNYSGKKVPVVGNITVPVKYENQEQIRELIVVHGNLPAFLGRQWFNRIRFHWKNVFKVKAEVTGKKILVSKSETFPFKYEVIERKEDFC